MFVDSHCHLDRLKLKDYPQGLPDAVAAARQEQVSHMLCVCIDMENVDSVLNTAQQFDTVYASVGVHPLYQESREPEVDELVRLADQPKVVAIGETGLDYFYCKGDLDWQRERFRIHMRAARETSLPVIIHTRDAKADTLAILREEGAEQTGGVLHCFTEDLDMARQAMEMGFYISISGIVTFRNAENVREVAREIPLDRLLIETDSPYLAPVPHRGKSNEPKYVGLVAEKIAELKQISVEEVAARTSENFFKLFSRAQS